MQFAAEPEQRTRMIGPNRQRLPEGGDGLFRPPQQAQDRAQIVKDLQIVRPYRQGAFIFHHRRVETVSRLQQISQIEAGVGIVRRQPQGLTESGLGFRRLPERLQRIAEIIAELRPLRRPRSGLSDPPRRLVEPVQFVGRHTGHMQQIGLVGQDGERAAIKPQGLGRTGGPLMLETGAEQAFGFGCVGRTAAAPDRAFPPSAFLAVHAGSLAERQRFSSGRMLSTCP